MENDPNRQEVTGVQDADGLDMWIRKSEDEIRLALEERDRRRRNLGRPLAWATALTVMIGILYSFGLPFTQGIIIVSSSRTEFGATTTILTGIVVFVGLFVSLARQQRRGTGLFQDNSGLLCGECKQPSHANQYMRCSCGGRLESLDHFDWVSEADRADADVRDQEEPSGHASV